MPTEAQESVGAGLRGSWLGEGGRRPMMASQESKVDSKLDPVFRVVVCARGFLSLSEAFWYHE